jgi:hypothetical protein
LILNTQELPVAELSPPSPARVVKRAMVMTAVMHRAFMEPYAAEPTVKEQCQRVLTWLERLNVLGELELNEKEILYTPLGHLPNRQAIHSTWRSEGLVVLAWALNCLNLPDYDELSDPRAVADSLYFLSNEIENLLTAPTLRGKNELEQYAERMVALHWRLRQFYLKPEKMNFKQFAKEAWFGPLDISGLRFIDNDLALGETEISQTADEEFRKCLRITSERHQTANWLIGYDEIYSKVATNT